MPLDQRSHADYDDVMTTTHIPPFTVPTGREDAEGFPVLIESPEPDNDWSWTVRWGSEAQITAQLKRQSAAELFVDRSFGEFVPEVDLEAEYRRHLEEIVDWTNETLIDCYGDACADEVFADCLRAYIDSQLGAEHPVSALLLQRELGYEVSECR